MPTIIRTPLILFLFIPTIVRTSGSLLGEFVRILFLQVHRETDRFFAGSGVQLAQDNRGGFHYRRAAFSSLMKAKRGEDSVAGALLDCRIHLASREGENT